MTQLAGLAETIASKLTGPNALAFAAVLATSLIASVAMYLWSHPGPRDFRNWLRFAFPREILTHPSARADLFFWVTRKLVMRVMFIPASASVIFVVGYATASLLGHVLGGDYHDAAPAGPWTIVFFTITGLLAYDLSYYLYHLAQHKIPILWELHKVHHSAEVMVGITKDRIHPVDELMNRVWDGLFVGVVYGVWYYFAVDLVEATILGVSVYVIRNILMMDFIRHTHLRVSFGPLNGVILCPHWHQLHHSVNPKHYDRNFGLLLSVWDRMFGTACVPEPNERFEFGIGPREGREYQSLYGLYILPLRRVVETALSWFRPAARPRQDGLTLEIVRDSARLDAVREGWEALERRARADVFQSHAWVAAWWRGGGAAQGFDLHIALAWRGADLVGVLPLVVQRRRGLRMLGWAANDCTDYCDALLAPGLAAPAVLEALWHEVERQGGFDIASINHLRPNAAARALPALGRRVRLQPDRRTVLATGVRLDAWRDAAAFFQDLGKKGRNNDLRGRRILAQTGPVRFRTVDDPAECARIIEQMRLLKTDWLKRENLTSPLLQDDGTLLRALIDALAAKGSLRLMVLEAGDRLAAGLVSMVEGRRLSGFLSAFDPEFNRASPGTLILVDYIRWAMEHGFTEVDFLRGDESYKGRLANRQEVLTSCVGAGTLLGRMAIALDRARAERHRLRDWLQARRQRAPQPAGEAGMEASMALGVGAPHGVAMSEGTHATP
ncbi:MAG: GNAT family N-acetyltransferase [Paracraurococcus sp.]|jgi:CelD/BcsL family acetyltransferase involved in cellulose biosynthesis/sterol desaturase/sphingolipid hydroxylase (fatty acid hydroxylase superfamily)